MTRCRENISVSESYLIPVLLFLLPFTFHPSPAFAAVKQEVYVTGTLQSFGGYTFTEAVQFTIEEPGPQEIGSIVVEGLYNGEYPWVMRIYTDNLHFAGVAGAVRRVPQAGLTSKDGRFALPLEIYCPVFGEEAFRRIPDINEPDYIPYHPSSEPKEVAYTDCILMGIDPRNAAWVAGGDGVLFTDDDNLLGDLTVKTPFELILRTDVSPSAVKGDYEALLYIETVPAP